MWTTFRQFMLDARRSWRYLESTIAPDGRWRDGYGGPAVRFFSRGRGFLCAAGLANRPKEKEPDHDMQPVSSALVLTDDDQCALLHGLSAHHRDFPEVRAEGSSPKAAAASG